MRSQRVKHVSDELMIDLIRNYLRQPELSNGWILEGYLRTANKPKNWIFYSMT